MLSRSYRIQAIESIHMSFRFFGFGVWGLGFGLISVSELKFFIMIS